MHRRIKQPAVLLAALLSLTACMDQDAMGPEGSRPSARRSDVSGTAFSGRIRIGVVPSASSVTLGSDADYTVKDKVTGAELMTGSNSSVVVTLASVVVTKWRLQVVCGSVANVAARKAAAEAAGHATYTEFVAAANCTRLYLGDFPLSASFTVRNNFRNLMISQGHAGTDSFYRQVAEPGVTTYQVTRGSTTVNSDNPVALLSADGIVTINGVRYRDLAEVRVNGAGTLAGINELPIEEYLYGVVPLELGPIAFPEPEAHKAQAVAARTYALAGLGKRGTDGYDLLATTSDQVYGGYTAEHATSSAAVDATRGIALTYDGGLISALYSSASGGHTADSEESFTTALPYLRGVPDQQRGQAFEHVPTLEVFKAHAKPTSLRAMREGDFESNWSRLHRWTFEWSTATISGVISAFAQQPVGKVLAITVRQRGASGRVLVIDYVTEAGTFTDTRDHIRSSLRFINADGIPSNLPSTLFFIEPMIDHKTGELEGYRVYGGGFGHGVGMGQTGAVGMAEKRHSYDEILKHYYRGVELTHWY